MINSGRPWFKFSAFFYNDFIITFFIAGFKLLNIRPPMLSCGTAAALWSDSTMPSAIGYGALQPRELLLVVISFLDKLA